MAGQPPSGSYIESRFFASRRRAGIVVGMLMSVMVYVVLTTPNAAIAQHPAAHQSSYQFRLLLFSQEYECQFIADSTAVLDPEDIRAMVDGAKPVPQDDWLREEPKSLWEEA